MTSFLSDWWEAFVISGCYEMGDPLGGLSACPAPKRGSQHLEMTRPGASESKKRCHDLLHRDSGRREKW
jgi:hypothetical protein